MNRGSALIVGIFLMVVFLSSELFFFRNLIFKHETFKRIGMEQEFIRTLGKIETFKRFLPVMVNYSWCETKSLDGLSQRLDLYANMYRVKLFYQTLEMEGKNIKIKIRVTAKGSYFEVSDVIERVVKVDC